MELDGVFGLSPKTAVSRSRETQVYPSKTYETFHASRYEGKFRREKPEIKLNSPTSFETSVIKFKIGFGGGQI